MFFIKEVLVGSTDYDTSGFKRQNAQSEC